jgi:3-oxoacyl-[acyl-carrier protein] reductase
MKLTALGGKIHMQTELLRVPTYPDLAGKVAVVTGSTHGTGTATARALAASGVRVVVNGRDPDAVEAMLGEIRSVSRETIDVPGDVSNVSDLERMRRQVDQEMGPVDILAAFVAGGQARPMPATNLTEEMWHSSVAGTLDPTFLTIKTFVHGMIERNAARLSPCPRVQPGFPLARHLVTPRAKRA